MKKSSNDKSELTQRNLLDIGESEDGYRIDVLGKFDNLDIHCLIDSQGNHWFTQEMIAEALDLDRTAISHMRRNHPGEFTEFNDYTTTVINGRRNTIYSEEGFLLVCDLSTSEVSFRLRRWMRKQFQVKQNENQLLVSTKQLEADDISDLSPGMQILSKMMGELISDQRRIKKLEVQQTLISEDISELRERDKEKSEQIAALEGRNKILPGEMTATQLADFCGWVSKSGAPHNWAVLLAASNANFQARNLIRTGLEEGPAGLGIPVEVNIFTVDGVHEFVSKIDALYTQGQKFTIQPNQLSNIHGHKNKRSVLKTKPNKLSSKLLADK